MLFVDYRAGSKELIAPLRKLGLEVEKTTLDFADVAFEGRGEKGEKVFVGIEFKRIEELVTALRTQRLQGHQLIGMRDMYKFSYLLYEGELLYDKAGALQQRKKGRFGKSWLTPMPGQMTVNELLKRINVLHLCGGLTLIHTQDREHTLQAILALYRTWTDKNLDDHKSHLAFYEAPPLGFIKPSPAARLAHTIDGIGWDKAKKAATVFKTPAAMCLATVKDWKRVEGIGDGLARKAVQTLQGNT